ncbi:MAG TPA: thioesterase family protein [Bacilli bacterium]|nr:thioesterase family protein [Bacilli bacterium]
MEFPNYHHVSPARVRFAETDANGHMSHVTAVIYMEVARCDLLAKLGFFDHERMVQEGKTFVLAKQSVEYRNQAYYNEPLHTYCRVSRVGSSSCDIDYLIVHADKGTLICVGTSTLVHFDAHAQKSTPLPDDFAQRLEALAQPYAP